VYVHTNQTFVCVHPHVHAHTFLKQAYTVVCAHIFVCAHTFLKQASHMYVYPHVSTQTLLFSPAQKFTNTHINPHIYNPTKVPDFSCVYTLFLSLSLSHTHCHTLSNSHTHTFSPLSPTYIFTHTPTHPPTHIT